MNNKKIRLKICGTRYADNMADLAALLPDYLGFIFYPASPRYMAETLQPADLQTLPATIKKTGVFVNASPEEMIQTAQQYHLQALQLHGSESPEHCARLKKEGFEVLKVFSLGDENFDFNLLEAYTPFVDYFLFDTKGKYHGGNGQSFNWQQLNSYQGSTPFFLSGGISLENISRIAEVAHPALYGIDVNSLFETEPGRKDVQKLQQLKGFIKQ